MRIVLIFLFVLSFAISNSIVAQNFQLSADSTNLSESQPKTKVLILATPHLNQISENFSPNLLDSLINALEKFSPDAIGIETLSGSQIAEMNRRGGVYKQISKQFANKQLQLGQQAQEKMDATWQSANIKADSLLELAQSNQQISDKMRLELVTSLLSSYRLHSAALQWSYISESCKSSQSVIPKDIATSLDEVVQSASESSSIGLRLAQTGELQRMYPIDDHLEKDLFLEIAPRLQKSLGDSIFSAIKNAQHLVNYQQLLKRGLKDGSLMPVYRYMNSPDYLEQDVDVQWKVFLRSNLPSRLDRSRLALWEVRNLNIAARIRKASTKIPGGRILVTIGASHKPFLDAYLKEMMDVEVVNLKDFVEP